MAKKNCWEVKQCGRQPGGAKVADMGVCPAATDSSKNGRNDGSNGGRMCWQTAGTFCGGKVQGTFAQKQVSCMACPFFLQVKAEEGAAFKLA
jgi:hypothetical protein